VERKYLSGAQKRKSRKRSNLLKSNKEPKINVSRQQFQCQ
jgi:hypothetical protein